MASWKKVIVSGSQAHLQGITASNLTNNTSTPPAQIVGYNPITGVLSYFDTSSIANPNTFVQGGNSFGTTATLGTNDANSLVLETNNTSRVTIDSSGDITLGTSTDIINSGDTTLGLSGSIIFEAYNSLPALVGRTVMDWKGINFDDAFGNAAPPGSTYLWRNSGVNHLYYSSSQLIQAGGNNTGTVVNPLIIGTTNASNLELETSNTTRLFISSSGNIGIGTATPTNTLQVGGTGISTTNLTASGLPTITQAQMLGIDSSGNITKFDTSSIVAGAAAAVQTFKTISVGGVNLEADSSTDTLTIASGSFGGVATTRNNLLLSGSQDDTLTISFLDSPTFTNITASGNISASGNLVINQITASGLPQTSPGSRQILMIDGSTGAVVRVTATELSGSVGVDSFRTISIGGVGGSGGPVVADSSTDTLNISSSDANLTVVGDSGTDTITFDFSNSPIFTHITASGNISSSGNLTVTGNSTIGGTLGVTGLLSANGALTTTNLTASGNISSSGNLTVTGTSTLTGRLTANGAITTTNITASGNISSSAGLIGGTLTTSGAGTIGDNLTVNGGSIITAAVVNIGAAATTMNIGATSGTTTVKNNLTVDGNLTVNGDTTILNTTELLVEDKFIVLASGSIAGSPQDSGIIIQTTTGSSGIGSGSALFLNGAGVPSSGTSRWGLAQNIPHNATSVAPTDYIMSVSSSAADPTLAPTYGSASAGFGNVHINTQSKTIWMYI
jgi:hypothetical protein